MLLPDLPVGSMDTFIQAVITLTKWPVPSPFAPSPLCDTECKCLTRLFFSLAGAKTGAERDAGPGEPQRQPGKTHYAYNID